MNRNSTDARHEARGTRRGALATLVAGLLLATPSPAQVFQPGPTIELRDEGVSVGRVRALDCVGSVIGCTFSGTVGTITISGGGGGAPTTATYITQTPDATLSAEQALSLLGTGLMFNTTGTGVVSIYGGTSCTNQALISLNASGVATCATITSAYVDSSIVPSTRTISTVAPLSGGGDLSANRTITTSMATARLLGRTTGGSGVAEEISVSSPLSLAALALSCPTCVTQAYQTIEDEGVARTQRTNLNFTGAGVSCVDSGGKTVCTISGGGGGGGNFVEVEVNFGTAGDTTASTTVTGQTWVGASSVIVCSPTAFSTADRSDGADDAAIEHVVCVPHTRIAATGFTVLAHVAVGNTRGRFKCHCTGA